MKRKQLPKLSRSIISQIVAISLIGVITGCSQEDPKPVTVKPVETIKEKQGRLALERQQQIQENKRLAAEKLKSERAKEKADQADKKRVKYIEGELKDSFGQPDFETSWYLAVKRRYSFVGNRIEVHTNIPSVPSSHPLHEEWDRLARATCLGVAYYLTSKENANKQFKEVQVLSDDGRELAMFS